MRKALVLVIFVLVSVLVFGQSTGTQNQNQDEQRRGSLELRLGILTSESVLKEGSGAHRSTGGLFSYYPFYQKKSLRDRFNVRGSLDFSGISSDALKIQNYRERLLILNFGAGFDVVRASRFDLIAHGGMALVRTSFAVPSQYYGQPDQNICVYTRGLCHANFHLNYGVEARYRLKKNSPIFVGVDYTRFRGAKPKSQMLFTLGLTF